jgi:hypothetical protein
MPEDNPAKKSFEAGARTAREAMDRGTAAAEQATKGAEQSFESAAAGAYRKRRRDCLIDLFGTIDAADPTS